MKFHLLALDTNLFGFKVVKIETPKLTVVQLRTIINKLRTQNVRLVYWPSDSTDRLSQLAALEFGGFLASEQITYLRDLKKATIPPTASEVAAYRAKTPTTELKQLALQAGTYSRFCIDPNFPRKLFINLYDTWIKNSVNGAAANEVLTIKHKNKIIGMVTLGIKNRRGDIGLLAVDEKFRGNYLATKLVYAAQNYFIAAGNTKIQVVTQKANIAACRLYEKCGFHQEKTDNFYHFWI